MASISNTLQVNLAIESSKRFVAHQLNWCSDLENDMNQEWLCISRIKGSRQVCRLGNLAWVDQTDTQPPERKYSSGEVEMSCNWNVSVHADTFSDSTISPNIQYLHNASLASKPSYLLLSGTTQWICERRKLAHTHVLVNTCALHSMQLQSVCACHDHVMVVQACSAMYLEPRKVWSHTN